MANDDTQDYDLSGPAATLVCCACGQRADALVLPDGNNLLSLLSGDPLCPDCSRQLWAVLLAIK